ncbi:MAG: chemotaxis-specific protein-glutamate methyltransferase CheB [Lachnospiraceae bacterium]|nr:chemotaxis-specific protein-glutamate methyltransferase CheB [Lachnospiraceae bacterium]
MEKKVLVIDDSALMRRAVSDIINTDKKLEVSDTANDGLSAIDLLDQGKQYDVILLDIHMPKMDGVQFLKELNKRKIKVPTVVMSSIASRSTNETIEALELGAFDFVKKPTGPVKYGFTSFRSDLLVRLYCACDLEEHSGGMKKDAPETIEPQRLAPKVHPTGPAESVAPEATMQSVRPKRPVHIGEKLAVIASSTGGPKALQSVIPMLPGNFPYPVIVVQHMPEGFTGSLASRLNEMSKLPVKEAEDGEILKKGVVYIAQGGRQCELFQDKNGRYQISEKDKPARGGLKPCADILLESLVDTSFDEIVCVVLTGMGGDGSKGILRAKTCKKIKVVAQDEATCVVYGMPRVAKAAGVVDEMVPLKDVAGTMIKTIGV